MVDVSDDAMAAAHRATPVGDVSARGDVIAEVFDGADSVLAALESIQPGARSGGFQSLSWLTVLYEELAEAHGAAPRLVVVTDRASGGLVLALPLIVVSDGMQREARFPDFGIADYGGPILGPVAIASPRHLRTVWRAVRRALKDCTLIRLENMPRTIAGRPNPLATRGTVVPSRHARHLLVIDTTVEDMLRGRGKKYRKEVERCHRLWEKEGATLFARAETATEAARAFATLDEQQAARHAALGSHYVIDQPEYRSFYERLAVDGTACDLCYLFTLGTETETIATLLGIVHEDTFTLLRISNGGERWSHLSPGRLIVVEAMRYFVERGLRRFDMGIGDYAFKRGFGIVGEGLVDLVEARRITGLSAAALHRLKARARQSALIGRLRGRKPAAPHA